VQVFVPLGQGLAKARQLAMIAKNAFEGTATPSGVWFKRCHIREFGPDPSDDWDMTSVMCQFTWDEQR